jgi:hypothetical protein
MLDKQGGTAEKSFVPDGMKDYLFYSNGEEVYDERCEYEMAGLPAEND